MKTPREILFHRHDTADAKLDALRRDVVAQLPPMPTARRGPFPLFIGLTVWRELILPARKLWAGLAAAWAFLLVANTQISVTPSSTVSSQTNAPTELWQKYQEEKQLLVELTGAAQAKGVPTAIPFAPRPRSERLHRWKVA